jgi:hypothetical protein
MNDGKADQAPQADPKQIASALAAIFDPGDVVELRAINKRGRKRIDAGYFDGEHRDALVREARRLNAAGSAVYVTLNPVTPHLLARYNNRVQESAAQTTTDSDIVRRKFLLLDFDPKRPADTSASDEQVEAAKAVARACYIYLRDRGWPEPISAMSGNGVHLLYRIELPNETASELLVKGVLAALGDAFDTAEVKVDRGVYNAARIGKLYGTVANKGDNTPAAPWRLSQLVNVPDDLGVVTVDQLSALLPAAEHESGAQNHKSHRSQFDLDAFLARLGIEYKAEPHNGGTKFLLEHCPFNPEHGFGEAAVFQSADGTPGFHCFHNACVRNKWRELRELVDGSARRHDHGHAGRPPWPDPNVIEAELLPVPAFDPEVLLPDPLRDWIVDQADRMPCAPDYLAAAAIVALGSIIGTRCAARPKSSDDWMVVPNLWGGVVATPSAKKSPAIGAALKPLDSLVAQAVEAHKVAMSKFESQKQIRDAQRQGIEYRMKSVARKTAKLRLVSNDKPLEPMESLESLAATLQDHERDAPKEPKLRRFKTNDCTIEKVGELLRDNPAGLLVLRDEIVGLIASWEREGREGDRAFMLEAWNGDGNFDTDRIGRGSIFVANVCLAVFGGIQPDKLTLYLEQAVNSLANDGMLQRFQVLVFPDPCGWEWRDRVPDKQARERVFDLFETLANFDPMEWGAVPPDGFAKFPHFRFEESAQEVFIAWSTELHRIRLPAEQNPIISQHLAKYDKLFPALALILHLVDCAATGRRGKISKGAALRAAAWCEFLEAHARRCYGLLADDGLRSAQALAEKVAQSRLEDGFTARDVRRHQWRYLTTDESVQAALDWLEDERWLRSREVGGTGPGTGRRTYRYWTNPKVRNAEGERG